MKIALLSDVHSNLEALTAVCDSIDRMGCDKVFFLGDSVGYGADPNKCLDIICALSDKVLAGNHDWAAIDKATANTFNKFARNAIVWTEKKLTRASKEMLTGMPLTHVFQDCFLVHATPTNPEDWDYITSPKQARHQFDAFTERLCFIGHSHTPAVYIQDSKGSISITNKNEILLRKGQRYIINNGSVGQPRDGNPKASYGIYNTIARSYNRIRVKYNIQGAQEKISAAGLPEHLAARLELGR